MRSLPLTAAQIGATASSGAVTHTGVGGSGVLLTTGWSANASASGLWSGA